MLKALTRNLRHLITAMVLLLCAILLTEFVLQIRCGPAVPTVTRQTSADFQPLLSPSSTIHHELRRLASLHTVNGVAFSTNSFGLRGPQPVEPKPPGVRRILMLGDETVLGASLAAEQTVPARLQQLLLKATGRDIEVVNAGIPGYSPLLSWLQFRHELHMLEPDLVILHFDMTDIADDAVYRRSLQDSEEQQICSNARLTTDSSGSVASVVQNSALCRFVQAKTGFLSTETESGDPFRLRERYEWTATARSDLRLPVQHALDPIQRFSDQAKRDGFRLLVCTSPVPWQVTSSESFPLLSAQMATSAAWPIKDDLPTRILAAVCERHPVPFCDSTKAFRAFSKPSRLFIDDTPQLSIYGALLYAREVASVLIESPEYATLFSGGAEMSSRQTELN